MEKTQDYLLNAEIAYSNRQYDDALNWYQKVLVTNPDDLSILSRAGSICVPLGKFELAFKYFKHAIELDPENGDNMFNYGNACFFKEDYLGAFNAYVEAESLGCSEDVLPRLYFQLSLICNMKQDIHSAITYFKKCEAVDSTGVVTLNPEFISEELKVYMMAQNYNEAGKQAAKLVAIQPNDFKNYMIYFSILMANKDYLKAEQILNDAKEYADLTEKEVFTITLQLASIYTAKAQENPERSKEYYNDAIVLLTEQLKASQEDPSKTVDTLQTLSEVYLKDGQYDKCITCLEFILNYAPVSQSNEEVIKEEVADENIEAMMDADMEAIQQKIDSGELDPDLIENANMVYDESGNLVSQIDDSVFDWDEVEAEAKEVEAAESKPFELPLELQEKVHFTLLTCYLAMDDFESAKKYAAILKHSSNKYYCYYGRYTEALTTRKTNTDTLYVNKVYGETIAYFRNRVFEDHTDVLAVIFRARLYAEQGKYEKAKELAGLLAESDQKSVLDYIEECKA